MTLAKHLAAALVAGLVLLLLSYKLGSYRDYQLAEVAAYVVAVGGLTVLIGVSGQLSIGQGAFMAIGGYAAALLLIHLAWPLVDLLVFPASAVITAAASSRDGGRGRGPAARSLPGRRDADAGRGAALDRRPVPGGVRRRPGAGRHGQRARLPGPDVPAHPVAGLGLLRRRADHPGAAGQPGPQRHRPRLARGPRRRGRGLAGRAQRGTAAGAGLCRQRRLRGRRRRAAGHRDCATSRPAATRCRCPSGCSPRRCWAAWAAWPARSGAACCWSWCPAS